MQIAPMDSPHHLTLSKENKIPTYAHYLSIVLFCQNELVDPEKAASILQEIMPYTGHIPVEQFDQVLEKMYDNYPGDHTREQMVALLIDSMAEVVDYSTAGTIAGQSGCALYEPPFG